MLTYDPCVGSWSLLPRRRNVAVLWRSYRSGISLRSPLRKGVLQVVVTTGQFLGLIIGLPYEFDDAFEVGYEWWRIMFLFTCLPAILQVRSHSSS